MNKDQKNIEVVKEYTPFGWKKIADMGMIIAVGFGDATVTRDGEVVYQENLYDDFHYLQEFERMASIDPDHDWRVRLRGPLYEEVYQRQGVGEWVLIYDGKGFA